MDSKKQEILNQAIELFNARGFHNVSIKDISDSLGISPGNLTYHFSKKTDLLAAIQQQMLEDSSIDIVPRGHITLYHFEQIFRNYSEIQAKYHFYYNNLQYIFEAFPGITKDYKRITIRRFKDAKSLIQYYIQTERLKPENNGINYDHYIRTIWMVSVFWTAQELMTKGISRNTPSSLDILWSGLIPYMTEKGYQEYLEIIEFSHPTPKLKLNA
ncbi:MAG: TetR/AcrR family transcriptional regulator [Cyclobacteriaceae bacterium]